MLEGGAQGGGRAKVPFSKGGGAAKVPLDKNSTTLPKKNKYDADND